MFSIIYKKHMKVLSLIFCIIFIISIVYFLAFKEMITTKEFAEFTKNLISNITTFMSITFGFYLTSISILFSSEYIKKFKQEDKKISTNRQIHTLKQYFEIAIYCVLLTIISGFVLLFLLNIKNCYIIIFAFSFFIAIFALNFVFIFLLLKVFFNAFVNQALQGGNQ